MKIAIFFIKLQHSSYDFDPLHLGHSFAPGLGLCFYHSVLRKWELLQQVDHFIIAIVINAPDYSGVDKLGTISSEHFS